MENKKGIYSYVLTCDEKYLSLRAFSNGMKQQLFQSKMANTHMQHLNCQSTQAT